MSTCTYDEPRGWRCTRKPWHQGSCALTPVWWMRVVLWIKGAPL